MKNSWRQAVQAAMDESDLNRLELKIQEAEVAIFQRIDAFSSAHDGEEKALFEALGKIRELATPSCPKNKHGSNKMTCIDHFTSRQSSYGQQKHTRRTPRLSRY
jgi:hypothetical protein